MADQDGRPVHVFFDQISEGSSNDKLHSVGCTAHYGTETAAIIFLEVSEITLPLQLPVARAKLRTLAMALLEAADSQQGVSVILSGLMGFSLIRGSCLEGGVFDPSILKTERPHRHLRSINMVSASTAQTQQPRNPLPRKRVRSLALPRRGNRWSTGPVMGDKQPQTRRAANGAFDPDVWCGRAMQEVFVDLSALGLASMYPASRWSCCAPGHLAA
jgi:hypothetical protein